jgi:hypothetical protein
MMKWGLLGLLLFLGSAASAQTLKELLYSGKLKNDSNTVIRRTDDLSKKIDTAPKPVAPPVAAKPTTALGEEKVANTVAVTPPAATGVQTPPAGTPPATPPATVATADENATAAPATPEAPAAPVKSPNRIWKEHTDALVASMKGDIQSNRKIKKESYYFTVEYEVETDGTVTILGLTSAPENATLLQLVKDRLTAETPKLSPVAKKAKRRYNFMITKD